MGERILETCIFLEETYLGIIFVKHNLTIFCCVFRIIFLSQFLILWIYFLFLREFSHWFLPPLLEMRVSFIFIVSVKHFWRVEVFLVAYLVSWVPEVWRLVGIPAFPLGRAVGLDKLLIPPQSPHAYSKETVERALQHCYGDCML